MYIRKVKTFYDRDPVIDVAKKNTVYLFVLWMRATVLCVCLFAYAEREPQYTDFGLFICAAHVQTVLLSLYGFGPQWTHVPFQQVHYLLKSFSSPYPL